VVGVGMAVDEVCNGRLGRVSDGVDELAADGWRSVNYDDAPLVDTRKRAWYWSSVTMYAPPPKASIR